ncbi:MAG: PKD domain-containing protein [Bacteroidota bacterium]
MDDVCFDTIVQTAYITAHATPIADFTPVEIENNPHSGTYLMENNTLYADSYYWDFGDGSTSVDEEPTHRYFINGTRQVYLEAYNDFGCADDTLLVFEPEFFKGLFFPNGFSPETGIGDAKVFLPKGVGLEEYHLQIFSPYGQLLWESKELKDGQPLEGWDGTHKGVLLPQDVYVWKCVARYGDGTSWPGQRNKKGRFETMGSVMLLR